MAFASSLASERMRHDDPIGTEFLNHVKCMNAMYFGGLAKKFHTHSNRNRQISASKRVAKQKCKSGESPKRVSHASSQIRDPRRASRHSFTSPAILYVARDIIARGKCVVGEIMQFAPCERVARRCLPLEWNFTDGGETSD